MYLTEYFAVMKCCFCFKSALGGTPITAPGIGPAHQACYEKYLIEQRVFQSLNLRNLTDTELGDLLEMATMERNARQSTCDEVEIWA